MEYCYKDHSRKCICDGQEHNCHTCHKTISDCEYVVNWGTCDECFSKGYEEYLSQTSCPFCPEDGPHTLEHEGKP